MSNESTRPTASLTTLGCKLNIADSEVIARRLREQGWQVLEGPVAADAVIINSCSVTQAADKKSRSLVRRARRLSREGTVVLTGCMVKTAAQPVLDGLGADLIKGPDEQVALTQELQELRGPLASDVDGPGESSSLRTRGFLAAQTGCNDVCAFCIIPRTRGRERSKTIEAVVAEAQALEAENCQEIVITGTQLGAYGRDNDSGRPADLLAALLKETKIPRIRLSSLQPQDIEAPLLDLWQDSRLCRHFHLALQSGSEAVLRSMRRRYTAREYRLAAERIKETIPGVAIMTDIIAGFPAEGEAEFEESVEFAREIGFSGVHVFPYSERSGTFAAKLEDRVSPEEKQERVKRLTAAAEEMALGFRAEHLGSMEAVLWETRDASDSWQGLTDNYLRVRVQSHLNLENRITPTRLTAIEGNDLVGAL